jgi:hypothetical protein
VPHGRQFGSNRAKAASLTSLRRTPGEPPLRFRDHLRRNGWPALAPASLLSLPVPSGLQLGNQLGFLELRDRPKDLTDHDGGGRRVGEVGWSVDGEQLDPSCLQQGVAVSWTTRSRANLLAFSTNTTLTACSWQWASKEPEARNRIADFIVTANKITSAIKHLACVTEAISARLLFAGGRSNGLMPVAQFNPFEKLDKPVMRANGQENAYKLWHSLSDTANRYVDGVEDELIGRGKSGTR